MVKAYNVQKGYGFITPDGARWGSDVFFHRTAWVGGSEPTVDEAVEFVEEMDARRGRLRAANVRPMTPSVTTKTNLRCLHASARGPAYA
jgi:CspA family cold shock protein